MGERVHHVYCRAKIDLMLLQHRRLALDVRKRLYAQVHAAVMEAHDSGKPMTIALPFMTQDTRACGPLEARLVYTLPRPRGDGTPKTTVGSLIPSPCGDAPKAMSANEAVLYRAHLINPMIRREIDRLRSEVADNQHWTVGYLKDDAPALKAPAQNHRMYRRDDFAALAYPNKIAVVDWLKPDGDNDLPVLAFYREHPGHDFYWVVEYDVRYTGHWRTIFDELRSSDADFLSTTVRNHRENPRWWWRSLVNVPSGPLQRVRCFTPFCRLSNGALSAIDQWYREGGAGHYEMTWPSICKTKGLKIEDIGGWGGYTPERWRESTTPTRRRHRACRPAPSSSAPRLRPTRSLPRA